MNQCRSSLNGFMISAFMVENEQHFRCTTKWQSIDTEKKNQHTAVNKSIQISFLLKSPRNQSNKNKNTFFAQHMYSVATFTSRSLCGVMNLNQWYNFDVLSVSFHSYTGFSSIINYEIFLVCTSLFDGLGSNCTKHLIRTENCTHPLMHCKLMILNTVRISISLHRSSF